ncbi:MAG: flagellar basal body P-ring protein FlgI [Phycisphaerae bacterium]
MRTIHQSESTHSIGRNARRVRCWLALLAMVAMTSNAYAQVPTARVGDVTRLQGEGTNRLIGYGLVTGLEGSGDGSKFQPTLQMLAQVQKNFGMNVDNLEDMAASKNTGLVMIEVIIPEHGAREGDRLDAYVTSIAAAKSLRGGRLLPTPLIFRDPSVSELFGFASGQVRFNGEVETAGVIRGGARIEQDIFQPVVVRGTTIRATGISHPWVKPYETYFTLVLDEAHAGWSMAAAIAQAVDKELSISADVERVALAIDSKSVLVMLPEHQRSDPASWIRDVERTPILMESNEARVTINQAKGTIVVTGDTRMSDVVVSQKGLTVTVANPLPDGTEPPLPAFEQHDFVALDRKDERQANVRDLLEALNRLKVSFEDRVSILEQIHRAGKLHARMIYEGA